MAATRRYPASAASGKSRGGPLFPGPALLPGAASSHPAAEGRCPPGRYLLPGKRRVPGEACGPDSQGFAEPFPWRTEAPAGDPAGAGSDAASEDGGGAGHQRGAAAAPLRPGQPGAVPEQPLARLPSAARGRAGCQAVQVTQVTLAAPVTGD